MKNKVIEINGMKFELTNDRTRRIVAAIIETQTQLDKELSYSEDLQKKDIIESYRAHIAKLQSYLA